MENYLKGREVRTVVKDEKSEWREVKSGVPHLTPILFLVYVNYMTEGVSSYISLFTDYAKLLRKIRNQKNCEEIQNNINNIYRKSSLYDSSVYVKFADTILAN